VKKRILTFFSNFHLEKNVPYVCNNYCYCYCVIGLCRVVCGQLEDAEDRAKQEAAKNLVGMSRAPVRHPAATVQLAADNGELMSDAEEVRELIHQFTLQQINMTVFSPVTVHTPV